MSSCKDMNLNSINLNNINLNTIDSNFSNSIINNTNFNKYVIIGSIFIFLLILIIFTDINRYIGYLIHNRTISPYLVNLFNHPLKKSYSLSIKLEKQSNNGKIILSGFDRIVPLIKPIDRIFEVEYLLEEIRNMENINNDTSEVLGDPITSDGHNYSFQIRLFNCKTKYSKYAPKCLKFVDSIATELKCKAIGVSIGVFEPNTWLKLHVGFAGYSEYITRAIIGIDCPENICALHICNGDIIIMKNGKMITFDDCSMHEAWNCSNTKKRTAIIFDLWTGEGFSDGKQALDDITKNLDTNHQVLKNPIRKKISLDTIKIIRDVINNGQEPN